MRVSVALDSGPQRRRIELDVYEDAPAVLVLSGPGEVRLLLTVGELAGLLQVIDAAVTAANNVREFQAAADKAGSRDR